MIICFERRNKYNREMGVIKKKKKKLNEDWELMTKYIKGMN
jgi:hypothetical protein